MHNSSHLKRTSQSRDSLVELESDVRASDISMTCAAVVALCEVYKQVHLLVVRILLARLDHKQHNSLGMAILLHSCCHGIHILSCHIIVR